MEDDEASDDNTNGTSSQTVWNEREFFIKINESTITSEGLRRKIEEIFKGEHKIKIFKAIVSNRNLELLRKLVENPQKFVNNVELDLWIELINLAGEKEFFEVFRELKKVEASYERKLNEKVDYKYKNVLDDISKLHVGISNARINEIEKFIAKCPKLKLCYGSSDFCALERSIDARQFHTYAFLRVNGFYSDKGQELKDKIDELDDEEKEKIRVEILKFSKPDPIGLILTKCDLDAASDVLNFQDIRQMLDELIKVEEIKPVLEILAQSEVKVIFDYNEESVVTMDPTADEFTLGYAYYREGILYVGRNSSEAQRFGTFAHEATHFALFLLYENSCLPYREEDEVRERVWEGIVRRIKEIYESDPEGTDNIIKWVYDLYSPGYQQKAELIVRVNDLLAFYHENPQKCEEVRETYRELFEFYRNHVMPDFNKNFYRMIKLNNELKLLDEITKSDFQTLKLKTCHLLSFKWRKSKDLPQNFILLSNVPQMTLSKILNEITELSTSNFDVKTKNIFINFERFQQENLRNELETAVKDFEVMRVIIHLKDDQSLNFNEENFEKILKPLMESNTRVQFVLISYINCDSVITNLNKIFEICNSNIEISGENYQLIEFNSREDLTLCSEKKISREYFEDFEFHFADKISLIQINLKHSWADLTESSKEKIFNMKVKFRNESFTVSSLFSSQEYLTRGTAEVPMLKVPLAKVPSEESLKLLSSEQNIQIKPKESEKIKFFIDRKLSKASKLLTLDSFLNETQKDKIVVISDLPGSGKSTLLHKVHEKLNEKFENFWVCFVDLLKHKNAFSHPLYMISYFNDFAYFLPDKVFNFNEIEKEVFELKYKRNEVVILFDGFDELPQKHKKSALDFFRNHKENKSSQIWIATRAHLRDDLEQNLDVKAHKLESISNEEQIKFLCEHWRHSCMDLKLIEKCAKLLVEKVSKLNEEKPSLIGLSLQLRLVSEYFKDKLCEDFDEKVQNLNFHKVFEFLIEKSVNIKNENSVHDILKLHSDIYEVLALKQYLDKEDHHLFGRGVIIEDLDDEKLEELAKGGIITYDRDKNIFFLHRTVLEFFVWRFMCNRIKNFKKNWKYEKEFFELLLKLLSSDMTRLDECFKDLFKVDKTHKNLENLMNFAQSFNAFMMLNQKIEKEKGMYESYYCSLELFGTLSNELDNNRWSEDSFKSLSHSTLFVLKCLKIENPKLFKKLIKSFFKYFVQNVKDPEICEKFLDEVLELYPTNLELCKLLKESKAFYSIFDAKYFKPEIFEIFWSKMEKRKFSSDEILNQFYAEIFYSKTFTEIIVGNQEENEDTERIETLLNFVKNNLKIEEQKKLFSDLSACLNESCERPFLKLFDFLQQLFDHDEILNIFSASKSYRSEQFFFIAAKTKVFNRIFEEIEKLACEEYLKEITLTRYRNTNILMCCVSTFESFRLIFNELFLKFYNLKDFLYEVDDDGYTILHYIARDSKFEVFEHFSRRAQSEMSKNEFKEFCKLKTKKHENIFHIMGKKESSIWKEDSVEHYVEFFSKIFTMHEMREILSEIDSRNTLPLHNFSENYSNSDLYKCFIDLYSKYFTSDEVSTFLKMKDIEKRNVNELSNDRCLKCEIL